MSLRDAVCFCLMGLLLPAFYFSVTGRPWVLVAWLSVWILTTIAPRNR